MSLILGLGLGLPVLWVEVQRRPVVGIASRLHLVGTALQEPMRRPPALHWEERC